MITRQQRPSASILDVRTIAPPMRRRLIFRAFDGLPVSGLIELRSDRDPSPLLVEVQARCAGMFETQVLEAGPDVWRVRLRKLGHCPFGDDAPQG